MAITTSAQSIEQTVREALAELGSDPEKVAWDTPLEDLDVDSLDLAELSQIVEERYAVRLTGADLHDVKTVGDAVELISSRVG